MCTSNFHFFFPQPVWRLHSALLLDVKTRLRGHLAYLGALSLLVCYVSTASSQFAYSFEGGGRTVDITNGRELAVAFSDPDVSIIRVMNDIKMDDADYNGLGTLPLSLQRNVTVAGAFPQNQANNAYIPVLDFNDIKDKLRLLSGMWLVFDGVVLTNYRLTLPSSSPGTDLLVNTVNGSAYVLLRRIAINNRLCFPAEISRKSVEATPRPTFLPGKQNVTSDVDQTGCTKNASAPWLQRCWGVRRHYYDVASMGYTLTLDRPQQTHYYVLVIDTSLLCDDVMTLECFNSLGGLGCFKAVTSKKAPPPEGRSSNSSSDNTPVIAGVVGRVVAARTGEESSSSSSSSSDRTPVIAGVVGGVIGGLLLAALVAVMAVMAVRRGWMRRCCGGGAKLRSSTTSPSSGSGSTDGECQEPKVGDLEYGSRNQLAVSNGYLCCGWTFGGKGGGTRWCGPGGASPSPDDRGAPEILSASSPPPGSADQPSKRESYNAQEDTTSGGADSTLFGDLATDPTMPVTNLTPIRSDVKFLVPERDENEVMVMPNVVRGKGAFGRVIEGTYKGQRVAVKLVLDVNQVGGVVEKFMRSFLQEVEVLGRCQHPNVVRLLAACLTPPRLCLVEELMETSLEHFLYEKPNTRIPLKKVIHIAAEICKGLEYLHPTVVHRDLKPGNVLLDDPHGDRPIVKITDFGLARLRSTTMPTLTPDAGTPAYLAPEAFDLRNDVITHDADMYSLAVMLWEMLAGEKPWRGCTVVEVAHKVTIQGARLSLRCLPDARCPPELKDIIRECWDADPCRRPAAAEVAKRLAIMLEDMEASGVEEAAATPATPNDVTLQPQGNSAGDSYAHGALLPVRQLPGICGGGVGCGSGGGGGGALDLSLMSPTDLLTNTVSDEEVPRVDLEGSAATVSCAITSASMAPAAAFKTGDSIAGLPDDDGYRGKHPRQPHHLQRAGADEQRQLPHEDEVRQRRQRRLPVLDEEDGKVLEGGQRGPIAVDLQNALVMPVVTTDSSYAVGRACTMSFLSEGALAAPGSAGSRSQRSAGTAMGASACASTAPGVYSQEAAAAEAAPAADSAASARPKSGSGSGDPVRASMGKCA